MPETTEVKVQQEPEEEQTDMTCGSSLGDPSATLTLLMLTWALVFAVSALVTMQTLEGDILSYRYLSH